MQQPIDYMNPDLPAGLRTVTMPVVDATDAALAGYGRLVDDPQGFPVEIVRWPSRGTRPIDADTGDQGGTTEGTFVSEWRGDILYGRNDAVGGHYILAYAKPPEVARDDHGEPPRRMMLWHANYHPDGGQLFFPLDRRPFFVPLALPGDDVVPERFVCFRFDGSRGLYIHPDIWHEGVFGLSGTQRFFDRQGAVHARVSVDFAREFGCLLEAPIQGHAAVPDHAATDRLAASWRRTCAALATTGDTDALRDALVARYAEPHRRYHTLQHLGECLAAFDDVVALAEHAGEVEMALWFHDAVYDVKAHDNEARSADWAERALLDVGVTADAARRVHALVMATRHDAAPATADARLLVDIDLSILGAAPARFDAYETQVRDEYAWVGDGVFRDRRRALLLRFLGQPSLYATAHFRERLEPRARDNLRRSVRALEADANGSTVGPPRPP